MAVSFRVPILRGLRGFRSEWLRSDISAGLSIAAVGLPSAIAYPAIAGLPPETGIYASIVAPVAYTLFGPFRLLVVGPDAATMTVLVAATLIYLLRKTMYPRDALLGRIPGRDGFYDMARFPDAVGIEGAAMCLIQGSVLFYNADYVRTRLRDIAQNLPANTRRLVPDGSAIVHLDSTGALALDAVHSALREQGIIFGVAELNAEAKALLERAGVAKHFGTENFFDDKEYVVRTSRLQEERNDMPARDGGEGQTLSPREGSHEQGA